MQNKFLRKQFDQKSQFDKFTELQPSMFKKVLVFCLPWAFISAFILIGASEPVAQIRPNTLSVKVDLYSKYIWEMALN